MTEEHLITKLKKHFAETGFVDSTQLMSDIGPIPRDVLVMHNHYALMVGCEITSDKEDIGAALLKTKEEMHSFLRRTLLALENKKGLIVDGYLLIILKQAPEEDAKEIIREIELDTKVCRKHIVWPLIDGTGLDRLQFVTILSLPKPLPGNIADTTSFELSPEAAALLLEYKKQGNLDRLMNSIKSGEIGNAS